jgi:DNA segregation ATPase FtsK/SpoIIIE, S-DNA-T family
MSQLNGETPNKVDIKHQINTNTDNNVFKTPSRVQRVIFNTGWFFSAVMFFLVFAALWSYRHLDPAWSQSTSNFYVHNAVGKFGAYFSDILYYIFGYAAYWFVALCGVLFVDMWHRANRRNTSAVYYEFDIFNTFSFIILLCSTCILNTKILNLRDDYLPNGAGGLIGQLLSDVFINIFGFVGSAMLLLSIIAISMASFLEFSWLRVFERIGYFVATIWEHGRVQRKIKYEKQNEAKNDITTSASKNSFFNFKPTIVKKQPEKHLGLIPKKIFSNLPKLDVWKDETKEYSIGEDSLTFTSKVIEHRLSAFGLEVTVIAVHPGPVVTLFELQLPNGVRSTQLSSLSRDIARELSVQHVRIIQNIPGKNTVGLELPNNLRQNIYMRQLIMGLLAKQEIGLHIALGVKTDNHPIYIDLSKLPHMLISGSHGSGKSVILHAIITSLLAKMLPQELRLVLIDSKMIEMTAYRNIPHLLTPIITDASVADLTFAWLVEEMDRRYKIMATYMLRHINIYNQKVKDKEWVIKHKVKDITAMPYIVIVVDELSDLMLSNAKTIELNIVRLAQKARACGIHLVLSTQRPTLDVFTSLIKANIPGRLALQVSSKIDSKLILDQTGAEGLLGKGDMLFIDPTQTNPARIHGVWIDDEEIAAVAQFWREQGTPNYISMNNDDDDNKDQSKSKEKAI